MHSHLKQLGVGSTIAGQLLFGGIGGAIFGLFVRRSSRRIAAIWTMSVFVVLPVVVFAIALWPVIGTSYIGLPIEVARLVTLIGFAACVFLFERTLVAGFRFLTTRKISRENYEFTPAMGRRAFVLGTVGVAVAGGGVALMRGIFSLQHSATTARNTKAVSFSPLRLTSCFTV